ncbi:MAG: NHL repeat-containing protein, partial [Planctomycetota bacterium]
MLGGTRRGALVAAFSLTTLAIATFASPPRAGDQATSPSAASIVERVTTIAPFPRGLAMVEDRLYVLCRGRVRGAGGVTASIEDQAGTIYEVDPAMGEPLCDGPVSDAVRHNGTVLTTPSAPPFRLWDRAADPPERDRRTDRPYCTLRFDEPTRSFYICAFSGIDKHRTADDLVAFSKNRSDALLRFDLRSRRWYEVERHDVEAGAAYPHRPPEGQTPPHGLLDGPDNCLVLGHWLYAVAKENSVLARYDLRAIVDDPDAPAPPSEVVLDHGFTVPGLRGEAFLGNSALAYRNGWLYIAFRTTSQVVRIRLDERFDPVTTVAPQLIARFDPYDPATGRSANLTDMDFDDGGRLYIVSAEPARIFRFTPDPRRVFDARDDAARPWAD